jgi:hypothetical protein
MRALTFEPVGEAEQQKNLVHLDLRRHDVLRSRQS